MAASGAGPMRSPSAPELRRRARRSAPASGRPAAATSRSRASVEPDLRRRASPRRAARRPATRASSSSSSGGGRRRLEPRGLVEKVADRAEPIGPAALEKREQLRLDPPPPVEQRRVRRRTARPCRSGRSRARERLGLVGRQTAPVHEDAGRARRAATGPMRSGWHRERIVGSSRAGSSATRMKMCRSVGSSSALSSAFWICSLAWSACSIRTTRRSPRSARPLPRAASGGRRRRCSPPSSAPRASCSGDPITQVRMDAGARVAAAAAGVAGASVRVGIGAEGEGQQVVDEGFLARARAGRGRGACRLVDPRARRERDACARLAARR